MHSDSSGSPRKRTLSRGLSEDESLRSIIKEAESSSRRLTRGDSRAGSVKRASESQSDQDLFMGIPEMLELQASYDEVVQEMRGLEVERETLLFQVDVLQDTLEGVEELLAEVQREAGQANVELEQEREAKRKLESMVSSLMKEVERLKEERNKEPAPVNTHGSEDDVARQGQEIRNDAKEQDPSSLCGRGESRGRVSEEMEQSKGPDDEGSITTKLLKIVKQPLSHVPSLALDKLLSEDGVLQRPYENGVNAGRDLSPDRNDSDDTSAYEDASAETPEKDGIFPGDGDAQELPDDSENKENNCQAQDPTNPDMCSVS
ncbi:unconventional myosin-XVIIIa [Solea solea]|uniref:unconventional myosin-XVIIIa n=1 Tax=Solea solea TaxID=90069 RepID=UPI002729F0A0|nr:unconventional myosin-XVIIIa [Solea solea]